MQRSLANSLRSLRPIKADLSLPLRRMSEDELKASLLYFSRFAHLFGTPDELVSQAAEAVTEAHTRVNHRDQTLHGRGGAEWHPARPVHGMAHSNPYPNAKHHSTDWEQRAGS